VYVHVPFCVRKCPYCAFYSIWGNEGEKEDFISALDVELRGWQEKLGGPLNVSTLYIGGGTPTLLSSKQWERLIEILKKHIVFSPDVEISVEGNPDSLTGEHCYIWREWGVKRVSLGVQSLHDDELRWLGRPHSALQALRALDLLQEKGFDVSADLMFGLANQTLRKWHESLSCLVHLEIPHLSIYQLSIEEGSLWGRTPPTGVQNGYVHYRWAQWYLEQKGLLQYEIASFARKGKECRHNQAYWFERDVLPLGPSAWGYFRGTRFWNVRTLEEYLKRISSGISPLAGEERLRREKRGREAAVLALRTRYGIHLPSFCEEYGEVLLQDILNNLENVPPECLAFSGETLALSQKGMRVANSIWSLII